MFKILRVKANCEVEHLRHRLTQSLNCLGLPDTAPPHTCRTVARFPRRIALG